MCDVVSLRKLPQLLWVVFAAIVMSLVGGAGTAMAHNSLSGSSPAEGDVLTTQPTTWAVTFEKSVPLASASAIVVNGDGVRTTLADPRHGDTDKTVVFDLPATLAGNVSARWRLVGSDGHVISGRVAFSVQVAAVASTTTVVVGPGATATTSTIAEVVEVFTEDDDDFVAATPEPIRLSLRLMNFLAIVLFGGLLFTELVLAPGTLLALVGRRLAITSAAALTLVPFAQYLVFVDDVKGATGTFGGALSDSLSLTLGSTLLFRATVGCLLLVIVREVVRRGLIDRTLSMIVGVTSGIYLLALSLGGHAQTEGTPWLGVPVDMLHTAAIAAWMGGLVTVVFIVAPAGDAVRAVDVFDRFGKVAERSMAIIVVTGVVQSARLHGGLGSIFTTPHGRLLLLKLAAFAFIVWLAARNRRTLFTTESRTLGRPVATRREIVKASLIEVGLGIVVLVVSAAMVSASLT